MCLCVTGQLWECVGISRTLYWRDWRVCRGESPSLALTLLPSGLGFPPLWVSDCHPGSLLTTSCISWHTCSLTWTGFLQTRGRGRSGALAVWRPLSPGHLFLGRQWSTCCNVDWRLYGGCFRDSLKDSPAERWVLYCGQWSSFRLIPKLTCTSGRHVSDTQNKLYYVIFK